MLKKTYKIGELKSAGNFEIELLDDDVTKNSKKVESDNDFRSSTCLKLNI